MHMIKSMKVMVLLTAATLICCGCADNSAAAVNNSEAGAVSAAAQSPEDISDLSDGAKTAMSVSELYEEIEQAVSLKSPQCMDDEFILNYYGIDVSQLEEYVFSMSEDAAQAETIIILKVKNTEDLATFTDCLQTIVEEKKNEMENYIPEQFAIVEKSEVRTKDNYLWLIISDSADEITDIIENGLF